MASTTNITCARPIPDLKGDPLYANSTITFHDLAIYICAPSLALTAISTVILAYQHIRNYTAPQEQRQILRIIALPLFYCTINFLALCWYSTYQYVQPLAGLYQSFAIAALFFLLLEWVCPEGTDREKYFDDLPLQGKKKKILPGGSLAWFHRTWAQIFQYPLITLVFTIIEIVTQYYSRYCSNSFSPKHAHLWLFLAGILIVAGALEATGAFAKRMGPEMDGTHKERAKIYSFLGIVFFQIIQGILFSLLNGKLFSPSRLLTYNDINYGLPALLTCLEAIVFSTFFHWAYSAAEFKHGNRRHKYLPNQPAPRLGSWRALRDALNLADIGNAVWIALAYAWRGLVSWWNGDKAASTRRGPIGKAVDFVAAKVSERGERSEHSGQRGHSEQRGQNNSDTINGSSAAERGPSPSPFDDSYAAGPAAPASARDARPGRVRTFDGRDALGLEEYAPLRGSRNDGDRSRDSSLSDRGSYAGRR